MADVADAAVVAQLVSDAAAVLDWCAGSDPGLVDDAGESRQVLPADLRDVYAAAVDQLVTIHVALALATLRGENPAFPLERVLQLLRDAGWDGAMRDFRLRVLARSGRAEVTETASGGRGGGGRIRRRIFKGFLGALNAALDSLSGLPGVGAIGELKTFVERVLS